MESSLDNPVIAKLSSRALLLLRAKESIPWQRSRLAGSPPAWLLLLPKNWFDSAPDSTEVDDAALAEATTADKGKEAKDDPSDISSSVSDFIRSAALLVNSPSSIA